MKKIISILMVLAMLSAMLLTAIPTFATDVNTDDLTDLIEDAEDLDEDEYTQESWEDLVASLEAANTALNDQYPTQDAIDAAAADLDAKIKALKVITRDDLKVKIDAGKLIENKGFSAESWKTFEEALADAEEFYEDTATGSVSQRDLQKVYVALKESLKEMKYDVSALNELIGKANGLVETHTYAVKMGYKGGDYTEATYKTLTDALATAKENVKSNDYDLIEASVKELGDAIKGLQPNVVPAELITELKNLLDLAKALTPTDWEETAWKMVNNKIAQGDSAPQNSKVSTYVKATTELETALKLLTNEGKTDNTVLPRVPTLLLDHLISWCDDNLKESGYTAETWAELAAALEEAKKISADPKTVKEVNDSYKRLNAAREALVVVEGTAADGDDGESTEVGCGGAIATTVVVMTAVLGLGATVVLRKKED